MAKRLFSERHGETRPRVRDTLDPPSALGLLNLVDSRINQNWFGKAFPEECGDGGYNAGCDSRALKREVQAFGLVWPGDCLRDGSQPDDAAERDCPLSRKGLSESAGINRQGAGDARAPQRRSSEPS
jgi:hypothetical protein